MKKILVLALLALYVILVLPTGSVLAQTTNTATLQKMSPAERDQAIEPLLREIGRLKALLAELLARSGQQNQNADAWCHTFNTNLSIGMSGSEVAALEEALFRDSGATVIVRGSGYYNDSLASAVSGFQIKYRSEILAPLGLANPTGYFGPATRAMMNRLYGCEKSTVDRTPVSGNLRPTINSVSGPRALRVGEAGTWTIHASDPENNPLTYAVIWSDGSQVGMRIGEGSGIPYAENYTRTSTFTHTYNQVGSFYPQFFVRDNSGGNDGTGVSVNVSTSAQTPPITPSLTVTSPTANSSWTVTNGPVITWSSNIPTSNQILVELMTPANQPVAGFSSFQTANDGSESGRLTGSSVSSGSYYFRLSTTVNGQTIYGGSGVFQFSQLSSQPTLRGFRVRLMDRATGGGLAGAEVRIERGGTYVASPTTGSDGYIAAIPLQIGATHTFTFSKAGYRPYSPIIFTIPVGSGTYTYGTIWLDPETITTTTYTLTTWIDPAGAGGVSKSPNQTSFSSGASVTLTASAASGYVFSNWSGNCLGTNPSCVLTMNANKSAYAHFAAAPATPSFTVSSPVNNSSWTSTNGPVIQWSSANIPSGNQITIELLTPSNGSVSGFSSFTTTNDGSESGRLTGSSVASGWYYFRLKTVVNDQTIYGGSGVFQFTAASAPPPTSTCGNGVLDSGEQCDGTNFGGNNCANYGYTSGSLSCSASCTLSTSQCSNPPAAGSITVTSPTASSRWTPTAFTYSVTWTSSNIPSSDYLTMELMTPANVRVNAFTPVSSVNDGSQAVNISNIAPGYYWFRLTATVSGQTVYGGSGVFQVVSN